MGSLDMGNVSWQVPAIHPYLPLNGGSVVAHTLNLLKRLGERW